MGFNVSPAAAVGEHFRSARLCVGSGLVQETITGDGLPASSVKLVLPTRSANRHSSQLSRIVFTNEMAIGVRFTLTQELSFRRSQQELREVCNFAVPWM